MQRLSNTYTYSTKMRAIIYHRLLGNRFLRISRATKITLLDIPTLA